MVGLHLIRGAQKREEHCSSRFSFFLSPFTSASLRYLFGKEEFSVADTFRQLAPIGFVYLMFISLIQNVQYLINNTIEEKSNQLMNRLIKVLLASVTSSELLMGKILCIGLSRLTTIAI